VVPAAVVADQTPAAVPTDTATPEATTQDKSPTENPKAKKAALDVVRRRLRAERAKAQQVESLKAKAKENPRAVLDQFGLTLHDITQAELAKMREENPQPRTPEEEIAELRERIEARDRKEQEDAEQAKQQHEERKVTAFRSHIGEVAAANPDRWELVHQHEAVGEVFGTIKSYVETNGQLPPVNVPANASPRERMQAVIEMVLDQLEGHFETEAEKLMNAKKLRSKFAGVPPHGEESRTSNTKPNLSSASDAPVVSITDETPEEAEAAARAILRAGRR